MRKVNIRILVNFGLVLSVFLCFQPVVSANERVENFFNRIRDNLATRQEIENFIINMSGEETQRFDRYLPKH